MFVELKTRSLKRQEMVPFNDISLRFTLHLIFIGPRIVIYSYSTTNKMHLLSQTIYSCKMLYMFRVVFPSIVKQLLLAAAV